MYLRLSRKDDKKKVESESITNQRNIILEYIIRNGFLLIDEYCDDGISGTTFDRPDFKRMIEDCEKGRINTIITKDMSRLGRDHIVGGDYMESYFLEQEYGNLLNEKDTNLLYYQKKINEYLSFKKPSEKVLMSLIKRIKIDEEKNIDIYFRIKSMI